MGLACTLVSPARDCRSRVRGGGPMAKNTGKGSRIGSVTNRSQVKNPTSGMWVKRSTASGRFIAVKKSGEPFKGVRREN